MKPDVTNFTAKFVDVLQVAKNLIPENERTEKSIFEKASELLQKYDRNHDGIITSNPNGYDEVAAMEKDGLNLANSIYDNANILRTDYQKDIEADTITNISVDTDGDRKFDFRASVGKSGNVEYYRTNNNDNIWDSYAGYNYKE